MLAEAVGAALLAAGLVTPAAGSVLIGTMLQAIRTVHWSKGPWVTNGGSEYNAVLMASILGIVEHGPLSLDRLVGLKLRGPAWALAAIAGGLIGPSLALRLQSRTTRTSQPDDATSMVTGNEA